MSKLKDTYIDLGSKPGDLDESMSYLAELASCSAIDVDNFVLGRDNYLGHVEEFANILGRYQLPDEGWFEKIGDPLWYSPLFDVFMEGDKDLVLVSEAALEMSLLRLELESVASGQNIGNERMKNMRSSLVELSRKYSLYADSSSRRLCA